MANNYRKGRIAEKKVANRLQALGFSNIRRTKGSRGPYDVYARSPKGQKVYVQVKSGSASMDGEATIRLRNLAKKRKGTAAYAHYQGRNKVKFKWLGNWNRR